MQKCDKRTGPVWRVVSQSEGIEGQSLLINMLEISSLHHHYETVVDIMFFANTMFLSDTIPVICDCQTSTLDVDMMMSL